MLGLVLAAALLPTSAQCNALGEPGISPPGCPDWSSVFRDGEGHLFADHDTLVRDGETAEIDVRVVFAEAQNGVISAVARFRVDCAGRTVAMTDSVTFDARGNQLGQGDTGEPTAPQEGRPNAALFELVCVTLRR